MSSGESKGAVESADTSALRISHAALSDIGQKRSENQDSYGIIESSTHAVFLVADGMGGVQGGAVASGIAVSVIKEVLQSASGLDIDLVQRAISSANSRIFEEAVAKPNLTGMGTTCVLLGFEGRKLLVGNVGDSRAYRLRGTELVQLTQDHTLVMELLRSGTISPDQAQNHPVSHMLTRSLGPVNEIEADCRWHEGELEPGDRYLLCSDGLYNLVAADEIALVLRSQPLQKAVATLVDLANDRGGTDNITVLTIQVGERVLEELQLPFTQERKVAAPKHEGSQINGESRGAPSPAPQQHATAAAGEPGGAKTLKSEAPQRNQLLKTLSLFVSIAVGISGALYLARSLPSGGSSAGNNTQPESSLEFYGTQGTDPKPTAEAVPTESLAIAHATEAAAPEPRPAVTPQLLAPEELQTIQKRHQTLSGRLADLDNKLRSFGGPLSGDLGELLAEAEANIERRRKELEKVREELEIATRKLAVWYGRRKRLAETDAINLASEIEVSSLDVQQKHEAFKKTTYEYLKESEVLYYNPVDQQQQRKVVDLRAQRRIRSDELAAAVRNAIESASREADQEVAELTLKRDRISAELESAKLDQGYAKILMGNDEKAKREIYQALKHERELVAGELESIERLLPGRGRAGAGQDDHSAAEFH